MSADFNPGQKVILRTPGWRNGAGPSDKEVVVDRVGRKYVYINEGWRDSAFDRETGLERGESNYRRSIGTAEMFAERDRLDGLRRQLADATRGFGWASRLSAQQIESIIAVLGVDK